MFDTAKPDGTPRKLMDSSRIRALGWKPEISLDDGIAGTYRWFLENKLAGYAAPERECRLSGSISACVAKHQQYRLEQDFDVEPE